MNSPVVRTLAGLMIAGSLASCAKSDSNSSTGTPLVNAAVYPAKPADFRLTLVDAPNPNLTSVMVNVDHVEVLLHKDGRNARLILGDNIGEIDLLKLQNGNSLGIADLQLPDGVDTDEIRIVLKQDGNYAVLGDGEVCNLDTPSATTSGIKIQLQNKVTFDKDYSYGAVLDFDAMNSVSVHLTGEDKATGNNGNHGENDGNSGNSSQQGNNSQGNSNPQGDNGQGNNGQDNGNHGGSSGGNAPTCNPPPKQGPTCVLRPVVRLKSFDRVPKTKLSDDGEHKDCDDEHLVDGNDHNDSDHNGGFDDDDDCRVVDHDPHSQHPVSASCEPGGQHTTTTTTVPVCGRPTTTLPSQPTTTISPPTTVPAPTTTVAPPTTTTAPVVTTTLPPTTTVPVTTTLPPTTTVPVTTTVPPTTTTAPMVTTLPPTTTLPVTTTTISSGPTTTTTTDPWDVPTPVTPLTVGTAFQ